MVRGSSWETGEGWLKVKALIELAKQDKDEDEEWTAERRERTLQKILARIGARPVTDQAPRSLRLLRSSFQPPG